MAKYKSTRRFDCAYNGKLYAIGSDKEVVVKTEATATSPASEKKYLPENQEVLKYLHELGHDGVVKDDDKKPGETTNQ